MIATFFSTITAALTGPSVSMIMLLVKSTLILLVAVGITLAMQQRASAGARHLVWLVTLATLLLVPGLTAWAPISLKVLPPQPVVSATTQPALQDAPIAPAGITTPLISSSAIGSVESAAPSVSENVSFSSSVLSGLSIIFFIWATVVLAIAASLRMKPP